MACQFNSNHLADKVDPEDDEAIDELFEELENEDLDTYREQRLDQLKKQAEELKTMKDAHHGTYIEVDEKGVLDITTKTKYVIVHFFHSAFARCKIMDRHLEPLSKKHFRARFVRANAELCPFLVTKLQIKVLPFVIVFINGLVVGKLVGFEQLGNSDDFKTSRLEKLLSDTGVIRDPKIELISSSENQETSRIRSSARPIESDEEC